MRLFFAVDMPELPPWVPRAERRDPGPAPASTHLTLRFLGERSEEKLEDIERAGREAVRGGGEFAVALQPIGAFPSEANPRIVWIGVTTGREELVALERALSKALASSGVPEEPRPFVPHVTWRRPRSRGDLERARAWLARRELPTPLEGRVTALHLKVSELSPRGAVHRTRATFSLGRAERSAQDGSRPTSS